jgi:hypothetical protein
MKLQFYLLGVVSLGGGGLALAQSPSVPEITTPPPTPTGGSTATTNSVSGCPKSICADYINECGIVVWGLFVCSAPHALFVMGRKKERNERSIDCELWISLDPVCTGGSALANFHQTTMLDNNAKLSHYDMFEIDLCG